jgi:hypothetical protein
MNRAPTGVLLRGNAEFHAGKKIQMQGRVSEDLFIFLIQEIVQPPINFDTAGQSIGEAYISPRVSLVIEEAWHAIGAGGESESRIDIERYTSDVCICIQR